MSRLKDRDTLVERVYATLRNDLRTGVYAPGDRIEIAVTAMRLHTSTSPVRAALNRLAGERLVEIQAHEGCSVPGLIEAGLREQFEWNHQVVLLALRWPNAHQTQAQNSGHDSGGSPVDAVERLIGQIGRRVPSLELRTALGTSNVRLHRPRQIEAELIPGLAEELPMWWANWASGNFDALTGQLQANHDRRRLLVPQIIERLHKPSIPDF